MRLATYCLLLCAGLGLFACDTTATTAVIVRPQLLQVDPQDFMGAVLCKPDFPQSSSDAGSAGASNDATTDDTATGGGTVEVAKSYVATVRDVTPKDVNNLAAGNYDFVLASSLPTRCTVPTSFSFVITGHNYVAHIDAYTQNIEQLRPIAPGSPLLEDAETGVRVDPRWVADCSDYPPSPDAGVGGAGGGGGNPGVPIYDSVTEYPHNCSALH